MSDNESFYRPPLVLAQARIAAADELAQDGLGSLAHGGAELLRELGTVLGALRFLMVRDRHGATVARVNE